MARTGTDPEPGVRHPPRPRLTMRVGMTGHRWDRLDRDKETDLQGQIRGVLTRLASLAESISNDPKGGYRPEQPSPKTQVPTLRLISPLAEGADRLLAQGAPKGWELQAILPFEQHVYENDFEENGSIEEFRELLARAGREAGVTVLCGDRKAANAFEPVGTAMCLNSDVMLTIWDGAQSKGRGPGGTATVVALAQELGLPVIRISPEADVDPWLHQPDRPQDGRGSGLAGLEEKLRRLFAPPAPAVHDDEEEPHHDPRVDLREAYFAEKWRRGRRGQLYGLVMMFLTPTFKKFGQWWKDLWRTLGRLPRSNPANYGEAIRARWRSRWQELQVPEEVSEGLLRTRLPDHYGWASYLANYYAGRYRSSSLLAYGLSWLAALSAGIGFSIGLASTGDREWVLPAAGAELVILGSILFIVVRARRGKFHERWLGYRQLTEALRPLIYTLPVARAAIRPVGHFADSDTWVDWIHRAIVREIGMLPVTMTPAHLEGARKLLVDGELGEQIDYHRKTATVQARVGHRLHLATDLIFYGALALAIFHFREEILHLRHADPVPKPEPTFWALFLGTIGITLPVLASAAHGFIAQGEFEETAHRARATKRELERLKELGSRPGFRWTCDSLGEFASDVAAAMGQEVGAWFQTYRVKAVPLP
jgi:hypothetical protein